MPKVGSAFSTMITLLSRQRFLATFSAEMSTDPFPGGRITSYRWKFGDGTTSTQPSVSHTYATAAKSLGIQKDEALKYVEAAFD